MGIGSNLGSIVGFLRTRKKWWLTPVLVVLLGLAGLIVLGQSSAVAPFIYALF